MVKIISYELIIYIGLTGDNIMDIGKMENNMGKAYFIVEKTIHGKREYGTKENESDG